MKLLFDHNLSPRLVTQLASLYPDSSHVFLLGLDTASDLEVWQRAKQDGYCLVTKDSDFNDLVAAKGFPPKVVWLRIGNCTTTEIVALLQAQHTVPEAFLQDISVGVLELQ